MAAKVKESRRSCCLLYGEKSDFLLKLTKDLSGEKPVEETQVVLFDGAVATVYTCEIEIDSKYHFVRLRVIASDNIQALLTDNGIRTAYQLPSDDNLPPVCSFIVACHAGEITDGIVGRVQQSVQSLATKWAPEGRILLGVPSFAALESNSIQQKNDFAKWAVKYHVELVEMECDSESCESFCEDGREVEEYGVERIMSALTVAAAFVEEKKRSESPKFHRLSSSSSSSSSTSSLNEKVPEKVSDITEQTVSAAEAASSQQKVAEETEQFDALFSRLVNMKERCQAMPEGEERHAYAEKVVTAFWKAIGGEEGELGSSSNSSRASSEASLSSDDDDEGGAEHLVATNNNEDVE